MPFDDQLRNIDERCADPQWREIILGVTHLTARPQDVRKVVEHLRNASVDAISRLGIDAMLCEIAVGPFNCPPDVCQELCNIFIREVEIGPWMPQRLLLLRLMLGGIYSPKVGNTIRERLSSWFPCRDEWRTDFYPTLVEIQDDEQVRNILFRGLSDKQSANQVAAALVIGKLARLHPDVLEQIESILGCPQTTSVVSAALEALLHAAPKHELWNEIEPRIRHSASIELRNIAIRRRIACGTQNENDLDELLWTISRSGPFRWRQASSTTVGSLVQGWPGSQKLRDLAVRCINSRTIYDDGIDAGSAIRILILGYAGDPVAEVDPIVWTKFRSSLDGVAG